MALILASNSPRRRELLALITPDFTVRPSTVDESRITAPTEGEIVAPESKLAAAVARGMEGLRMEEVLALLGQTVQLLQALLDKDESIYIGDEEIYRAAGRGSRKAGYPVGLNPAFR